MTDSIGVRLSDSDFYPIWKSSDSKTRRAVISSPVHSGDAGLSVSFYRSLNEDESSLSQIASFVFSKPFEKCEIFISHDEKEDTLYLYLKSDQGEEQKAELDLNNLFDGEIWHREPLSLAQDDWDDNTFANYKALLPEFFAEDALNDSQDLSFTLPLEQDPQWDDSFLDGLLEEGALKEDSSLANLIREGEDIPESPSLSLEEASVGDEKPYESVEDPLLLDLEPLHEPEDFSPLAEETDSSLPPQEMTSNAQDSFNLDFLEDYTGEDLFTEKEMGDFGKEEDSLPSFPPSFDGEDSLSKLEEDSMAEQMPLLPLDEDSFQGFLDGLGEESLFDDMPLPQETPSLPPDETLSHALPWEMTEEPLVLPKQEEFIRKESLEKDLLDLDMEIALDGGAREGDPVEEDSFKAEILEELFDLSQENLDQEKRQDSFPAKEGDSLGVSAWEFPLMEEEPVLDLSSTDEIPDLPWQVEGLSELEELLEEDGKEGSLVSTQEFPVFSQKDEGEEKPGEDLGEDFDLDQDFNLDTLLKEDLPLESLPQETEEESFSFADSAQVESPAWEENFDLDQDFNLDTLLKEDLPLESLPQETEEEESFSFTDSAQADSPAWEENFDLNQDFDLDTLLKEDLPLESLPQETEEEESFSFTDSPSLVPSLEGDLGDLREELPSSLDFFR